MRNESIEENRRVKILFVSPTLGGGGAERVFATLLRTIDTRRFAPTLAVLDAGSSAYLADLPGDVAVVDLDCKRVRNAFGKLLRLIWELRPDIVFSSLDHLNVGLGMSRAFWPRGSKLCARPTLRVSDVVRQSKSDKLWSLLSRLFLPAADGLIFQSEAIKSDFFATTRCGWRPNAVINNPLDLAAIRARASAPLDVEYAPDRIHLVAAGRLAPQKAFDVLLEAVALLDARRIMLTILGAGSLQEELQDLTRRLGLTESVRFLGFQSNPYPHFARADMFVLSSKTEGFPNVVLEALACGAPVVATAIPGLSALLENVDGCEIVAIGDPQALASAIAARIATGRARISDDALDDFEAATVCRRYEDFFLSLRDAGPRAAQPAA